MRLWRVVVCNARIDGGLGCRSRRRAFDIARLGDDDVRRIYQSLHFRGQDVVWKHPGITRQSGFGLKGPFRSSTGGLDSHLRTGGMTVVDVELGLQS